MFIVDKLPKSITAESYRSLRTNIQYSSIDKQVKTLVVTSSNAGEGKSTVAGNLAYTFFQSGKRVLIIDCDLRKPSLHRKFNVSNEVGLTDVLVGTSELNKVMKKIDDNLYLLTTGTLPPNPAEIIGSNTMENFLGECKINFDYIILDNMLNMKKNKSEDIEKTINRFYINKIINSVYKKPLSDNNFSCKGV